MHIAIDVPDDVAQQLKARGGDLPRRTLEALAIDAYRAGEITEAQVQQMLRLASRWEVDALLKRAGAYVDYSEADLEQEIAACRSPG